MKSCKKCNIEYSLDNFYKKKGGRLGVDSICKICDRKRPRIKNKETASLYYKKNKEKISIKNKKWALENPDKMRIFSRKSYQKHKTSICESRKSYRITNSEKIAEIEKRYRDGNLEAVRAKNNKYRIENPEVFNAKSAKRRAAKIQRTPKWLSDEQLNLIKQFYIEAKILESVDGIKRHVDHIIPLQGKTVSGLHVPWNLQILTEQENRAKLNKLIKGDI
jgi:5-methylcytosine-specific restriction endonuclease McrA